MFSSSHPGLEAVPLQALDLCPTCQHFQLLIGHRPKQLRLRLPETGPPCPTDSLASISSLSGESPSLLPCPCPLALSPPSSSTGVRIHFLTHGSSQRSCSETLDLLVDHIQVSWEADEGLLAQPHLPLALLLSPSLPFLSVCLCLSLSVPLSPAGPCASCSFLASPPLSC